MRTHTIRHWLVAIVIMVSIGLIGCNGSGAGGDDAPPATNTAPAVEAGPDQAIALADAATLNATVTDDGLPQGSTLSYAWTQDSGPGTVNFADASAEDTTATFDQVGDYVLRLTVGDSDLSGSDTLTVTVSLVAPVGMGVYDATVVEGAGNLQFLVTLSENSSETITVAFSTVDGTAVSGEDYQATSGQLSFAAGETRQTVSVPVLINSNTQNISNKSLHLELSAPVHATIERAMGVGTIIDKDQMLTDTAFVPGWGEVGVFANAESCANCHAASTTGDPDVVMRSPITDPNGEDVSPSNQWDHSVMAHAFDDPYYQAAVEDEVSHFPNFAGFIEDTCLTCHTPMARTHAHQTGAGLVQDATCTDPAGCYRFADALTQNHAREGVSCTACHQIQDDGSLGTAASFSGAYTISDTALDIYGPYNSPFGNAMQNQTMYTPAHGAHMQSSNVCATCHTLYTPTINADTGALTTIKFLEQGPFLEWKNSVYFTGNAQERQCQDCHMAEPTAAYATPISTLPAAAPDRTPFGTHNMVGGNTHLLELLRDYRSVLGIEGATTVAGFDEKIQQTRTLLQSEAAALDIQASVSSGQLNVDVLVTNKTGHKLPTAYPSRRTWIHFSVKNAGNQVIFESGRPDGNGYISTDAGRLAGDCMAAEKLEGFSNQGCFEPHRDVIDDPSQVAIYETVLGDTNGHITHTLLLAGSYLKDNRLPPEGFTNSQANIIEVQTVPVGVTGDGDFNCVAGTEGCGTDTVHYSVPVTGQSGPYMIEVRLLYQAIQPGFVNGLHAHSSRVDRFKVMYEETPPTVEVLAVDTLVQ